MNNTDPKLSQLADNGGPTLTMALLPGSPAINAGDPADTPSTDQRGVPRPQGAGVDIGAYEYQFNIPAITGARFQNSTNFWLQLCGLPNQTYTLQASTNLLNWFDVTNLAAGVNGAFQCYAPIPMSIPMRFYRLKSISP
jgi:hypothetical protein